MLLYSKTTVRASSGEVPGEKGNGHDLDTGTSLLDYPGGVPHRSSHSVGSCLTCGARKATPSDVKLEPLRLASRNSSNIRPLRPVSSTMYPAILGECKPGTDYSTGTTESRPARLVATCFPRAWVGFCRPTSTSLNLDPQGALGLSELLQVLSCGEESATVTFESLAHSCHEPRMRFALTQIAADERRHQVLLSGISAALPPPRMDPEFAARMRRFFMRLAHHWTAVRGPLYRPVWQQGGLVGIEPFAAVAGCAALALTRCSRSMGATCES